MPITVTINGIATSVERGTTILNAARDLGIEMVMGFSLQRDG